MLLCLFLSAEFWWGVSFWVSHKEVLTLKANNILGSTYLAKNNMLMNVEYNGETKWGSLLLLGAAWILYIDIKFPDNEKMFLLRNKVAK